MKREALLYAIAIAGALTLAIALATGLILWLALPSGHGAGLGGRGPGLGGHGAGRSEFAAVDRHTWVDLHNWAGIALVAVVGVHLALNWRWVREQTQGLLAGPPSS
jgi:hypothetical protein